MSIVSVILRVDSHRRETSEDTTSNASARDLSAPDDVENP
jgi:hypothetical protein